MQSQLRAPLVCQHECTAPLQDHGSEHIHMLPGAGPGAFWGSNSGFTSLSGAVSPWPGGHGVQDAGAGRRRRGRRGRPRVLPAGRHLGADPRECAAAAARRRREPSRHHGEAARSAALRSCDRLHELTTVLSQEEQQPPMFAEARHRVLLQHTAAQQHLACNAGSPDTSCSSDAQLLTHAGLTCNGRWSTRGCTFLKRTKMTSRRWCTTGTRPRGSCRSLFGRTPPRSTSTRCAIPARFCSIKLVQDRICTPPAGDGAQRFAAGLSCLDSVVAAWPVFLVTCNSCIS